VTSTVVVTHVDQSPIAVNDTASTPKTTATDISVLANDSDPDGDALHVASVDTSGGTQGTVTINPDGMTIHYDPNHHFDTLPEGQTTTDTFTYKAADPANLTSNSATVTVTIVGTNFAPVLTVSDIDSPNLASATVSITQGLTAGDTLSFTNQNGISGSYNAGTGVLTMTGAASPASYQAALRSVAFSTNPAVPTGTRTVSFAVNDGATLNSSSNTVTRDIDIMHHSPPVANTDTYGSAGTPATVGNTLLQIGPSDTASAPHFYSNAAGVLANDTDATPTETITLTTTGAIATTNGGTATMNADGTFTYLPPQGFTGEDSFSYTISDGTDTANGTVNVWVGGPRVWYVDNSQASAGDGRSSSPFNTLPPVNAKLGTGDILFLYQGSGAPYTGGVVLKANMKLLGQPAGLTVSGRALVAAGGGNPVIANSGGDGIDLAGGVDVERVDVSGTSGAGIKGTNVATATIGSLTAIGSATGGGFVLTGAASGNVTEGATITTASGHSVAIDSRSGGIVTLSGPITDTGTGVNLSSNSGATINLTGTVTATTGANTAFNATGGGTVTATNASNALATTTGAALNVANTTIGANGLTFSSISAGTGSSGPAHGISLSNTGTAGGLTLHGGTIQHTSGSGIVASGLHSLTLTGTSVQNAGTPSNPAVGVQLTNAGDLTLDAETDTFQNNSSDGLGVLGTGTATFAMTVKNNTFTGNTGTGVNLAEQSGANTTAPNFDIEGNTLNGQQGNAINIANLGLGTWTGHVIANNIGTSGSSPNQSGSKAGSGINVAQESTGTTTVDVSNNHVYGIKSEWGINGQAGNGNGTLNMTVAGNTVDTQSTASLDGISLNSGILGGDLSTVCLNATGNTSTSEGSLAGNTSYDTAGLTVIQNTPSAIFQIQGYTGSLTDDTAIATYLGTHPGAPNNVLSGPGALANGAFSQHNTGFTAFGGTCPTAPALGPSRDIASGRSRRIGASLTVSAKRHRTTARPALRRRPARRVSERHAAARRHTAPRRSAAALRRIATLERLSVTGGGRRPRRGR
jgi:hypothetical protein